METKKSINCSKCGFEFNWKKLDHNLFLKEYFYPGGYLGTQDEIICKKCRFEEWLLEEPIRADFSERIKYLIVWAIWALEFIDGGFEDVIIMHTNYKELKQAIGKRENNNFCWQRIYDMNEERK